MPMEVGFPIFAALFALLIGGTLRVMSVRRRLHEVRTGQIRRASCLRREYGLTREEAYLAMHIAKGGSLAAHSQHESQPIEAVRMATKQIRAKMERADGPGNLLLGCRPTAN